jgi:formylglycine-generating enzyme required for sulfatase activity
VQRLRDCIEDLGAAADRLRGAMAHVNDPELRSRFLAFVRANDEVLAATGTELGPEIGDQLSDLLTGLRRLDISVRDPDFGLRPALEPVEAAAGVLALRLIAALDAAAAMGWHPRASRLPEPITASVRREEAGPLFEHIARRLDMVADSLDQLAAAGESTGSPSQKRLIEFYVGTVRVELDLAKMQLTVGETTVDLAALWRSVQSVADLTGDFLATLSAWAQTVAQPVRDAGETLRRQVQMVVQGVARAARFVARRRRQREQEALPTSIEGTPSPLPASIEGTPSPLPASIEGTSSPLPASIERTPSPLPASIEGTPSPLPASIEGTPSPLPASIEGTPSPLPAIESRDGDLSSGPPRRFTLLHDAPFAPQMVALPAGEFLMGSPRTEDGEPDERPQRRVTIARPFAIGCFPLTFAEYDQFCSETHRTAPDDKNWGRGRKPVINVSWEDAGAYLAWLSAKTGRDYRLPSEAEWEYACRAGTTFRYSFGERITPKDANYSRKIGRTSDVGTYPPNPWGLYDVHGNVFEWVEDVWHDNYQYAPNDGSPYRGRRVRESSMCVVRGGSWGNNHWSCRSAFRGRLVARRRYAYVGFRAALTLS